MDAPGDARPRDYGKLLTLTGHSGTDPEAGTLYSRVDFLDQPQLRTITATVQLRF